MSILVTFIILIVASLLIWAIFDDAGLVAIATVWMVYILYMAFGYHGAIVSTLQNVMRG